MKRHLQTTRLALCISLILICFSIVNADTSKTTNSDIRYQRYSWRGGQKYHRFLPATTPKGLSYSTELKATANIDDTPGRESVVLMLLNVPTTQYYPFTGKWVQAFLLLADETEAGALEKKVLFKLFDAGTHALEVPTAKPIELQSPAFVFTEPPKDALKSRAATFRLVDLTGDGILDVWVEFGYAVAVISFQNGEFKEVFSCYTVPGLLPDAEYVDLDNDGSYEIKIPYSIPVDEVPGAPDLPWMSLYEWNGTDYVLNNAKFYADNDEFLIRLLNDYNHTLLRHGSIINLCETYKFYLGLVHSYRRSRITFSSVADELIRHHDQDGMSSELQWILEHGKNENYIHAIKSISKSPPLGK
ncbi:hypothetical protein J5I95_13040 [Candidatus Poribacteria bacterium]|nr:hypothetical protein [Candidatus Poribacteria bacterium]